MIASLIVSLAVVGALVVSALHEAVTRRRIVAAAAEQIAAAYKRGYERGWDDGYTAGYATVQYETDQQVDLQALDVIAQRLQTTELPMN